jgi:integrase
MAFLAAIKARVIRQDPIAGITPPRVPKAETKMNVPTSEQVGKALAAAGLFRAFVAVCAFAGLRLGESAGLQPGDVDFLRRTLLVRRQIQGQVNSKTVAIDPKYESVRTVYLADALVKELAAYIEKHPRMGAESWLFANGAYVWNRNSASNQWRSIRKPVGMEEFTLHDLRHYYASGLIAAGCDVVTVRHALGHSSPTITLNIYSHLWPKAGPDSKRGRRANEGGGGRPADSVRTMAGF